MPISEKTEMETRRQSKVISTPENETLFKLQPHGNCYECDQEGNYTHDCPKLQKVVYQYENHAGCSARAGEATDDLVAEDSI